MWDCNNVWLTGNALDMLLNGAVLNSEICLWEGFRFLELQEKKIIMEFWYVCRGGLLF